MQRTRNAKRGIINHRHTLLAKFLKTKYANGGNVYGGMKDEGLKVGSGQWAVDRKGWAIYCPLQNVKG
jgi:hypothetical protein